MATGTVKKVIADRGFGFITAEDEKDYFFHRDALDSSLDFDRLIGGERVEFEIEAEPQGPARCQGARRLATQPSRELNRARETLRPIPIDDHRHAALRLMRWSFRSPRTSSPLHPCSTGMIGASRL